MFEHPFRWPTDGLHQKCDGLILLFLSACPKAADIALSSAFGHAGRDKSGSSLARCKTVCGRTGRLPMRVCPPIPQRSHLEPDRIRYTMLRRPPRFPLVRADRLHPCQFPTSPTPEVNDPLFVSFKRVNDPLFVSFKRG